jgi:hypothetical protein
MNARGSWSGTVPIASLIALLLGGCPDHGLKLASWGSTESTCLGAYTPDDDDCYETPADGGVPLAGDYWDTIANIKMNMARPRCLELPNATGAPGTTGAMTVDVMTETPGGRYGPANSGAIWIETSPPGQDLSLSVEDRELAVGSGEFVRSLEYWAAERFMTLVTYGATRCASETADVVTSATLPDHSVPHKLVWDGLDFNGNVAPDGEYVLWLEITEDEFIPVSIKQKVIFTKGPEPSMRLVGPIVGFASISLAFTPGATAPEPAPTTGAGAPAPEGGPSRVQAVAPPRVPAPPARVQAEPQQGPRALRIPLERAPQEQARPPLEPERRPREARTRHATPLPVELRARAGELAAIGGTDRGAAGRSCGVRPRRHRSNAGDLAARARAGAGQ